MRDTMANVKDEMPFEERRRKLLAEGALLRIGIMDARVTVRSNLNAESLAKSAVKRMFGSVSSTFSGLFASKGGSGMQMPSLQSLQSYSPYLLSAISLLSKRSLRKPLLYGGIISAGAAMAYYLTRKRSDAIAADAEADPAAAEADFL